jgi:hypothetical protein
VNIYLDWVRLIFWHFSFSLEVSFTVAPMRIKRRDFSCCFTNSYIDNSFTINGIEYRRYTSWCQSEYSNIVASHGRSSVRRASLIITFIASLLGVRVNFSYDAILFSLFLHRDFQCSTRWSCRSRYWATFACNTESCSVSWRFLDTWPDFGLLIGRLDWAYCYALNNLDLSGCVE